jgi:hypothetical protein
MISTHKFTIVNGFVTKLVNVPDINGVSRLAFNDF